MKNLISLACGLAAWILPLPAFFNRKSSRNTPFFSISLCAVSLFFQLLEYERMVLSDAGLAVAYDVCDSMSLAATVLLAVTLAENLLLMIKTAVTPSTKKNGSSRREP